jgi:hypothetical protein
LTGIGTTFEQEVLERRVKWQRVFRPRSDLGS